MTGFYIELLSVQGKERKPAEISFKKGCNVVTGASDTGKSYIFSVINYIFGKGEEPKNIIQSSGYEFVLVQIKTFDDEKTYTLHRRFGDDNITVKECDLTEFRTSNVQSFSFKTKGDVSSSQHISHFLMGHCQLLGRRVLKNKTKGQTENLGFSSLRKLLWVDEVEIVKTTSPFYFSGGNSNYTKDQSVISLLLSGDDFSEIQLKEDRLQRETRISGKIDFIIKQIHLYSEERDKLSSKTSGIDDSNEKLIEELSIKLETDLALIRQVSQRSALLQEEKLLVTKELLYNKEIERRFEILTYQYESDRQRLEFILEADLLSSQLGNSLCPICSSNIDRDTALHMAELESFRSSAQSELEKIKVKQSDLSGTINAVKNTITELITKSESTDQELNYLQKVASDTVAPRIEDTKRLLSDIFKRREALNKIHFIDEEVKKLYAEQDRLQKLITTKTADENISVIDYSLLAELSSLIQSRLERWNYEKKPTIVFNSHYRVFDIAIAGKDRKSYGKGKRAISYAACILGLLDYCVIKDSPFPNLIVLDSPLTTFEEKKVVEDSEITQAIQSAFFNDLAKSSNAYQIIVFDNKEPEPELQDSLNTQIFTGILGQGRQGFYPET